MNFLNLILRFAFLFLVLAVASCSQKKKDDQSWTKDKKTQWLDTCEVYAQVFDSARFVDKSKRDSFCACMLEVTVSNYTPKQAFAQDTSVLMKRFKVCNFEK